ncbi:hypothetical protein OIE63_03665 [Streptomyces sp. NBC_01795]|uniref:hypothetical protein n=1 Tax=Streptomyces sp. NBC_01795 TaxID=2975943 RepID=UPI002DDA1E81|nr:hypothetical protein [Streptomyces sp. NBC_01795]WSA90732.1 hypothetical protein OIE63_03665 [Streptomyces sp. NBC_01795]
MRTAAYPGELDTVCCQGRQAGQGVVLLAVHEHPERGEREKTVEQLAVAGELDLGIEDRLDRLPSFTLLSVSGAFVTERRPSSSPS